MIKKFISISMLSVLFLTGCTSNKDEVKPVIENKIPVETKIISPETITNKLVYAGKVNPDKTISVVSKISGKVESTNFEIGDTVKEGDILFTLSKSDINDQIKQIQAQVAQANTSVTSAQNQLNNVTGGQFTSTVNQLESGISNATTSVANAEVAMNTAKLALENAETNYNSTKILYDSGAVSKTTYDQTKLALDSAKSSYDQATLGHQQATTALDTAKSSLDLTTNDITADNKRSAQLAVDQAIAARNSANVQLEIAKSSLENTQITAPISGVISGKTAKKDEYTSPQSPAYVIVSMDKVTVDVKVSEQIINSLQKDQSVNVTIKTISDTPFTGVIKTIAPAADATSTYPISVQLDNKDNIIKPGMFAEVNFTKEEKENTILVPRNSVMEDGDSKYVFLVKDGKALKTEVTTGIDNGKEIEITSGINISDEVITKGQSYVANEDLVNVSKGE